MVAVLGYQILANSQILFFLRKINDIYSTRSDIEIAMVATPMRCIYHFLNEKASRSPAKNSNAKPVLDQDEHFALCTFLISSATECKVQRQLQMFAWPKDIQQNYLVFIS